MSRDSTPLMQQYTEIKGRHRDAILLFRMGDFYEMFYEDAEVASRVLGLTLTTRNNGGANDVPLAGVPVKAVNEYLRRLVHEGFRVAICEQVEDPRFAKGIVRREVVETITPGAALADDLLDGRRNNYLCAIHVLGNQYGIAAADVSTGALDLVLVSPDDARGALARFSPREVLVADGGSQGPSLKAALDFDGVLVTGREAWEFDPALAAGDLARHFGVHSLEGLGIGADAGPAVGAAGALVRYLRELRPAGLAQLARPRLERAGDVMPLDEMTRRNLELVESLRGTWSGEDKSAEASGTLLGVLDRTRTAMGARLLRRWLLAPLVSLPAINERLDAVAEILGHPAERGSIREGLGGVGDIERLAGKAAAGRVTPRELAALASSLEQLPGIRQGLASLPSPAGALTGVASRWDDASDVARDIVQSLVDRPPAALGEVDTIRAGVDADLDGLRMLRDGGRDAIARIQTAERERTGIASLRVGYNRVFGYYIEVTNSNRHLVPDDYQRRQTLTGAERYVTPGLKEYEERILTASERIEQRERDLFEALRRRVAESIGRIQHIAADIAQVDVFVALAEVAVSGRYARPEVADSFDLRITAGRHPVVERMMSRDTFIPNDVTMDDGTRVIVLTGPNMAGKSTILRQIGLIQIMAQVGSFVPATAATLGIVDRLFTRVGASDNLVRGQSTFMVEMAETSAILHGASKRSLVLLDEVGRGTSTYDGVSIAWAVSEHLHDVIGCKTVFATHYHELTQLGEELAALRNLNVGVREVGDEIVFLHRLLPGGADRSYGIEVGRLAGLPPAVIARAREVLRSLEQEQLTAALQVQGPRGVRAPRPPAGAGQLTLFPEASPLLRRLRSLEPNTLTPLDALRLVDELVREARET